MIAWSLLCSRVHAAIVCNTSATMSSHVYCQHQNNTVRQRCGARNARLRAPAASSCRSAQLQHRTPQFAAHDLSTVRPRRPGFVQTYSSNVAESGVAKVLTGITNLFPVWVVLGCLSGELQVISCPAWPSYCTLPLHRLPVVRVDRARATRSVLT